MCVLRGVTTLFDTELELTGEIMKGGEEIESRRRKRRRLDSEHVFDVTPILMNTSFGFDLKA